MPRGRRYEYVSIDTEIDLPLDFSIDGKNYYERNQVIYTLNSMGFRSDEFTTNHHNKRHILFAGCSVTWGTGLPIKDTWSYKLYKDFCTNQELSGYFNLSYPGGAATEIIYNILKYIRKYGKPNEIYLMLPEIMRGIHMEKSSAIMHTVQIYDLFESYCDAVGIKLFSFTWDLEDISGGYIETTNDFFDGRFKTFHRIDYKKFAKSMYDFSMKNPDKRFLLHAGDGQHFGIAHHVGFIEQLRTMVGK